MPQLIHFTKEFSESLAKLPANIQRLTNEKVLLYTGNPNANGLHSEKLRGNKNYWSLRVNDSYRIIYLKLSNTDEIILLHVNNHDDVYRWADTHTIDFDINGVVIIYEDGPGPIIELRHLFECLTDRDFDILDVPAECRTFLVNNVVRRQQLAYIKDSVSEITYECLELILSGSSKEEALQFYNELTNPSTTPPSPTPPLFEKYSSLQLAKIGVPEEYIDVIRQIRTKERLQEYYGKLPELAFQNLISLLNGKDIDSIIRESKKGNKPANSIKEAIHNPGSKTTITPPLDEKEVKKLLEMPMELWRTYLHPKQREEAYRDFNGPARVLGGAGTGKTVIIVHRAKYLASKQNGNILISTYTRTLADDIEQKLKMICTADELSRIEVKNVDAIARDICQTNKIKIIYDIKRSANTQSPVVKKWEEALRQVNNIQRYPVQFYIDEWRDVIQSQQISTLEEYLKASRPRRTPRILSAVSRQSTWLVFEKYRELCLKSRERDIDWAENETQRICNSSSLLKKYSSILIDECQDLRAPALRMFRSLAGSEHLNDIYLAGDLKQKIYAGPPITMKNCGININGRATTINTNYRTSSAIYESAQKLLKEFNYDDPDDEKKTSEEACICVIKGEKPKITGYTDYEKELAALADDICNQISKGIPAEEMCIVARTTRNVYACKKILERYGINDALILTKEQPDDKSIPGVRLATMHRVKGMEFRNMYIVKVKDGEIPLKGELDKLDPTDPELINNFYKQEANLLAMAMTRAKERVWISYHGKQSGFITTLQK